MGFFERRCRIKPYEGEKEYIFVSYSHKDKERVFPVIEGMVDDGHRVWFDEGIVPGEEWTKIIAEHLDRCCVFICFLSRNSLESKNCMREVNFAIKKNKYFITVMLEEVSLSPEIDMQLSPVQMISRYKYKNEDDFFEKLYSVAELQLCLDTPEVKTAPEADVSDVKAAEKEEPVTVKKEEKKAPAERKEKKKKKSKPAKEKKKGKKGVKVLLIALAAALVLMIIGAFPDSGTHSGSVKNVTANMLWGSYGSENIRYNKSLMKIMRGSEPYTVYSVPSGFSFAPDKLGSVELKFTDEFGVEYSLIASFTLSKNVLTVSPYTGDAVPEAENQEFTLAGETSYRVSITVGRPVFSEENGEGYVEYYNLGAVKDDLIVVSGKADAGNMYSDISSISVKYDTKSYSSEIEIGFPDGKALDITGSWGSYSNQISAYWRKEDRYYNGRTETFSLSEGKNLKAVCINTYPYGMVLIMNDSGEIYTYQDR